MSDPARQEILSRIHAALTEKARDIVGSHASIPRVYQRFGRLDAQARIELFIDRLRDYNSEIIQVETEGELPAAISLVLQDAGERRVIADPEFSSAWLPVGTSLLLDNGLSTAEIDTAQIVLTTCETAIASTGTIILIHGGAQGRRAITLLPDHHICLVRRDQIVELVPEAFQVIASQSARPMTTISGPSATSDIEMTRIRGVHGPRYLTIILYGQIS